MNELEKENRLSLFPSSPRRGGRASKEMLRSHRSSADGVVINDQNNDSVMDHHPVCGASERDYFFCAAATPPRRGGENAKSADFMCKAHRRGGCDQ